MLIILAVIFSKLFFADSDKVPVEIFKKNDFRAFEDFTKKVGSKKSYDLLKSYFSQNESDAHDFAHVIGFVAADQGLDGLSVCDNFYNYGCYHGFMQIYLGNNGVSSVVDMEAACLKLGMVHAPSCLHGIGHGLMMEASYDLNIALKNCRMLNQSSQTYCFDGVFMERLAGSMLSRDRRIKLTSDTLFEPCDKADLLYKRECWRNQVSAWFGFFEGDTAKIGSYCAAIEKEYWQICFESLGLINVQNIGANEQGLIKSCGIVNSQAHDYCILGEVKELLFEGKPYNLAYNLCFLTEQTFRDTCLSTYNQMYADYQVRFGPLN